MLARSPDWNDWQYFLAVVRNGSTLSAGRALNVSQTTAARRVAALEQALDLTLFERRAAGYQLTEAGRTLVPLAEAIEQAASAAAVAAQARGRDLSGSVRLTTQELFETTLLAPILLDLHARFPDVRIEVDSAQEIRDLGAGHADIALRALTSNPPAGVVGRPLCVDDWTLYCSKSYASRHGIPRSIEALASHTIIGGGGGMLWHHYQAWLKEIGLDSQVTLHQGSSGGLLSAVRSGLGIAVLPCLVADLEEDMVRCLPPRHEHGRVLWLLTHERVRRSPAVRAVIDFVYDRLALQVRRLREAQLKIDAA